MNPLEQAIKQYETVKDAPEREFFGAKGADRVPALTRDEIGEFYKQVTAEGQTENPDFFTPAFLNALIQRSYNEGNNDFHLEGDAGYMRGLAGGLEGARERPLALAVKGKVCGSFGTWARHCQFILDSNLVTVPGRDDQDYCTFKTSNVKTLGFLTGKVPRGRGNRIYFVDKDGTESIVMESR